MSVTPELKLLRLKGSLASGEYPLINPANPPTPVYTIPNVKYAKGLQTAVRIPMVDEPDHVNVAVIGGWYYWITQWREVTTANGQLELLLDYMAPTSQLPLNQTFYGYMERAPKHYWKQYLSESITDGLTEMSDLKALGNVIANPYDDDDAVYWVQITVLFEGTTANEYRRYGCFVSNGRLTGGVSDVYIDNSVHYDVTNTYPSLSVIMNNVDTVIPSTASAVQDISISRRCPYKYKVTNHGSNVQSIALADSDNNVIAPGNDTRAPKLYYIDNYINTERLVAVPTTHTFTLTDLKRMSGTISIRDWNKNKIASLPLAQSNVLTVQTYSDLSGIYTIIDNGYQRVLIPEGKLPWNGSEWAEYRAYQMDTDRVAMQNAIEYARYDWHTRDVSGGVSGFGNAVSSMIFGAIAGKGAGAVAGGVSGALNMWALNYENDRAKELSIRQAQDDFAMQQRQALNAKGTAYSPGYGLIYVALTTMENDLVAGIETPIEGASDLLAAHTDRFGWPTEGYRMFNASTGYWKGYLPKWSNYRNDYTGMLFDELNTAFRNGFRFVDPA